jgi:type I restriction enzyme M protein
VRQKAIKLTPEEAIRQLYLQVLTDRLHYPLSRIRVEYGVNFGREVKRADIVVMDKDRPTTVFMLVELKKPKLKDGKDQLRSYCNATGAPIAVWTNGDQISYYQRKDPNYFEDITDLPNANQTLADILQIKFTLEDLIKYDKLLKENKSLKTLIEEMEDEVLANAGVDVFEELFKLIFTKLYDEWYSGQGSRRKTRSLEFRNTGQTEGDLKSKIQQLFDGAKKKWEGVFSEDAKISLTPSHLSICVSSLENVKLFNSNLDVVDEAFEYLINQSSKGDKGQYFTPRYVIDMCVKMLNPTEDEYMIDTAAGSSGFPVHTIFHVWRQILVDEGLEASHLFSLEDKPARCNEYVEEKVFGIDFDEKAVRVARTLNLIAGDGQTNVLHLNTLDYELWDEVTDQDDWDDVYNAGFKRLKRLRPKGSKDYREFRFDVLMANPPFAGDIKEPRMIARYDLGKKPDGKWQTKVGRDILFIERNLDFLKPGGRMAIVLPQGRFNNSSDKNIRDFIAERCRILSVVGLHGNTFKPHTGTKTSVLLVQKWNDDPKAGALCPRRDDYSIFFATMQKSGKDNSGEKIYIKKSDGSGELLLDEHDHLIIDHDLFNHDGLTQDGIAEAFIEFAKKENLSFFKPSPSMKPFNADKYQQLMDGLEAAVINLSELERTHRIDSEFFRKEYLEASAILETKSLSPITNFVKVFDGNHAKISDSFTDSGVPYYRGQDMHHFFIEQSSPIYIDTDTYNLSYMKRSHLKKGDVLLSIVGTIGSVSLVKTNQDATCNCKLAILRTKSTKPEYLAIFLKSKFGQSQIQRFTRGAVQMGLILEDMNQIVIPEFSNQFENTISSIVLISNNYLNQSDIEYQQAEDLLLLELGLNDWQPTEETIAIKSFSESFLSSGRLDSEHYKPKYDQVLVKLKGLKSIKIVKLEDILLAITNGQTPLHHDLSIGEVKFLTAEHIHDFKINYGTNKRVLLHHHQNELTRTHLFRGDILLTIKGRVGNAAVVENIDELVNINQDVAILRLVPEVNPYYVAGFINSSMGKLLVEKTSTGQINPFLSLGNLKKLSIPIFANQRMNELGHSIKSKIDNAYKAGSQSQQLLEIAKIGVERAIETDEAGAIAWMNQQLEVLEIKLT